MAYDRYEDERGWRDRPSAHREERGWRDEDRQRGRGEERGFFERAGDEISSWFGGGDDRSDRDQREEWRGRDRDRDFDRGEYLRDEYGREDMRQRSRGWGAGDREDQRDYGRGSQWERDPYRRTSFAGSAARSNRDDPHYEEWRRQRMEELDREYEDYCRERHERFETDFTSWRERRQSKRQLLGRVREQMEVIGSDGKPLGRVDRVSGDRIILTSSDPESGGVHHSLSCTDIDRIEDERVVLEPSADQARRRWRDERRHRALFEREDQGAAGPHVLDRSFSGTYR